MIYLLRTVFRQFTAVSGILLAMVFVLLLTMATETLVFYLHVKHGENSRQRKSRRTCNLLSSLLRLALWKMVALCLGYLTMLSVMSMNVWLMVSAILGSGLAHMFLRPIIASKYKSRDNSELSARMLEKQRFRGTRNYKPSSLLKAGKHRCGCHHDKHKILKEETV